MSATIEGHGQAEEEPERRRLGSPWWAQSRWSRGPGSLRQDDGGRAERLRPASSKSPLGTKGEEAQALRVTPTDCGLLLLDIVRTQIIRFRACHTSSPLLMLARSFP